VRLLPRDERFFDLFTSVATLNVEAAKHLNELFRSEGDHRSYLAESIKRLEHEADALTHEVISRLDRSFITPLDREDIHLLASRLDDFIDRIDGTARRIQIFRPGPAPPGGHGDQRGDRPIDRQDPRGGPTGWVRPILFIFLSPLIGALAAILLTTLIGWSVYRLPAARLEGIFRRAQLLSAAAFSVSHGANDAQKTMGIIVGLLVASQHLFKDAVGWQGALYVPSADTIPLWIEMAAYTAIALGTALGGWRIVKTMGTRITKLRPFGGFCAETGGAVAIFLASALGIPVSTTHTITGAIVGVGTAQRLSAVRWGVAGQIVWAWILTIPMAASIAALSYVALR
jgi:hypothetical protein